MIKVHFSLNVYAMYTDKVYCFFLILFVFQIEYVLWMFDRMQIPFVNGKWEKWRGTTCTHTRILFMQGETKLKWGRMRWGASENGKSSSNE